MEPKKKRGKNDLFVGHCSFTKIWPILPRQSPPWRYVAYAGGHGMYQIAMEKPALWMSCVYPGDSRTGKSWKPGFFRWPNYLHWKLDGFSVVNKKLMKYFYTNALMRRSPKPNRFWWFKMFWWTLKVKQMFKPLFLYPKHVFFSAGLF